MHDDSQQGRAELFLVRVWRGSQGDVNSSLGKVQHVMSGSVWMFDDWQQLIDIFLSRTQPLDETAPEEKVSEES